MSSPTNNLRKIGPFQLVEEIGVGGMGTVYRAVYEKNQREVAVKVLSPDLTANESIAQRFIRETEILKKLKHPNIIKYYGAGWNRTQRFYAMELVDGSALDEVIRERGALPWQEVIDIGLQVAKALEHAHNAGIIHRDLKPGNLLISKQGVLKLSDFGIARDTQATALTQAGKTVGTMHYMAPEQITGKSPITRRTDIYALGCVLYQLLTGKTPFESTNQADLLFKHLDEPPPRVRDTNMDVPIWLDNLVDEMMAKDPEDRPFDALAVQVMLEDVRKKVKEQETKLRATTVAGDSELTQQGDKTVAIKKKRKKKKKQKQATTPFYEKPWFLASCLGVIVLVVGYLVMSSRSESTLYDRAAEYMASEEANDWVHAEKDLESLIALYPDGEHAEQAQLWLDQIEMYRAERRVETNVRFGREPKLEAERLYVEAQQYEKFGDRLTALEKYEAMPNVIKNDEENRPFLNLARRQAGKIKASVGSDTDRTAFIEGQLAEAATLYETGKTLEARKKWQAIIRLYGSNPEFEKLTAQASQNLFDSQ